MYEAPLTQKSDKPISFLLVNLNLLWNQWGEIFHPNVKFQIGWIPIKNREFCLW